MPAKAMKGRLRIERTGTNVAYFFAEEDDEQFTRAGTAPFSADDLAEVRLVAINNVPMAALDVRYRDIEIRAAKIVKSATASPPVVITPPQKDYAQEYKQSFKGAAALPAGWGFVGPFAENCVRVDPAGLNINLASGWGGERPGTGIKSGFGLNGDFEITLTFEILAEPSAAEAGKAGTRLSLAIAKEAPHSHVATINRSVGINNGTNFVSWQSIWNEAAGKGVVSAHVFATKAMIGRLRLVRSGPHLYYGFAEGLDGEFRFRAKYNFGPEDLREVRIVASTGGDLAAIELRASDLHLRADAIPNMPATAPVVAVMGEAPAPSAAAPSRTWLVAFLIIAAMLLAIVAALGAVLFLTRARRLPPPSAKEVVKKRK
jgi:hypothetical protein